MLLDMQLMADWNVENMLGIIDAASLAVIFGSFALVIYNIRKELKTKL